MKKVSIFIFFLSVGVFSPAFGQVENRDKLIKYHLELAQNFSEKEQWGDARYEYKQVLVINPNLKNISVIYYQLCLCCIALQDIDEAKFWFEQYKAAESYNKKDIYELKKSFQYLKNLDKIKYRKVPLAMHSTYLDFKYSNAYASFERGSSEYFYYQHTMSLGLGANFINNHSWSFEIDLGAYYVPNAEFVSMEDYKWSFRFGFGFRYIHKYPLFTINKLCFRVTGYGGSGVEYLAEGGEPIGGYDGSSGDGSISDYANSFPYELSTGLLITSRDIPRGIRIEAFYQGHWQRSDPSVIYRPYFGVTVAFHLGINL